MESKPGDTTTFKRIIQLVEGVENESRVHTALLLYKGIALRLLGLLTPARDILSKALRRKKDRPFQLLHDIRYQRALVYEAMGQKSRFRKELERIYADNPGYEDVAERLGL